MIDLFLAYIAKYPISLFESICVLPVIILGVFRRKYLDMYLVIIWLICLIFFILDLPMWYLALQKKNNYFWHNTQEAVSSLLWIFSFLYLQEKIPRKLIYAALLISFSATFLDFQNLNYSSILTVCNRLIFITLSFIFFFKLLQDMKVKNILCYPPFWIISGLCIFSSGTILLFIFTELTLSYTNSNESAYTFFYYTNDFLKILWMAFIFTGFLVSKFEHNE